MKKYTNPMLLLLLVGYCLYSFVQHYSVPLDGDMAQIVLPVPAYQTVMNHPFGLPVILEGLEYPATNRFFAHFSMATYFQNLPGLLQNYLSPISSIYFSAALAKTGIQFLLIWLLAAFSTGKTSLLNKHWLLAAVLVAPLFQTFGYNNLMGIIDKSITYTFFYAFSIALTGLFLLPFFNHHFWDKPYQFTKLNIGLLTIMAFIVAFNGPLNPAVILLVCPAFLLVKFKQTFEQPNYDSLINRIGKALYSIHKPTLFLFSLIGILCLYSVYIGMYNSEDAWHSLPLLERYARLPEGLFRQFTNKPGPILLIGLIVINTLIVYFKGSKNFQTRFFKVLKWGTFFSLAYIILLPLGGYREYRPDIIRRDTILPVLLLLLFLHTYSSQFIIAELKFRLKPFYGLLLTGVLLVFLVTDAPNFNHNECEKQALAKISQSTEKVIQLQGDCTVMTWEKIDNPEDSKNNIKVLHMWNVLENGDKRYHH